MKYLDEWIESITLSHPDLRGYSICPFAKTNTYKIINCSINDIKPLNEKYGVVIFVIEDDLKLEDGHQKIKELNETQNSFKSFI